VFDTDDEQAPHGVVVRDQVSRDPGHLASVFRVIGIVFAFALELVGHADRVEAVGDRVFFFGDPRGFIRREEHRGFVLEVELFFKLLVRPHGPPPVSDFRSVVSHISLTLFSSPKLTNFPGSAPVANSPW
jgi:hypothetical protein